MDFILNHAADLVQLVLAVLGALNILARLTPTEADNKVVQFLLDVLNKAALNK